ncbi:MAG TPA: formylglycine-generating enzyme family protein [Planctomycetaceae bacterium]|nr:formylglycine-generating enzyme family protein [Planctomycetaceae bacterium]
MAVSRCPLWIVLLALAMTPPSCAADTPELDALLKRFVDEFVSITPGKGPYPATFEVGSQDGPDEERPVHTVKLARPFAIGKYEVPQNLYAAVMGQNPSRWKGPRNSAESMSWLNAVQFCEKVTGLLRERKLIAANESIRLPTEAEWEYACRAGTKTKYSFGDETRKADDPPAKNSIIDQYAWFTGNAAGNDPEVGKLAPNPWGLYDMHGYLWEFTADGWEGDYRNALGDGSVHGPTKEKPLIVLRGGSWKESADKLRSSSRKPVRQSLGDDAIGFRCVRAANP